MCILRLFLAALLLPGLAIAQQHVSFSTQDGGVVHAGVYGSGDRGRGQSRGPQSKSGEEGAEYDVLAAVRYLRKTGAKTVAIIGASFGGEAAADASIDAEPGEIDRLVLLAAWTDCGYPGFVRTTRKLRARKSCLFSMAQPTLSFCSRQSSGTGCCAKSCASLRSLKPGTTA